MYVCALLNDFVCRPNKNTSELGVELLANFQDNHDKEQGTMDLLLQTTSLQRVTNHRCHGKIPIYTGPYLALKTVVFLIVLVNYCMAWSTPVKMSSVPFPLGYNLIKILD